LPAAHCRQMDASFAPKHSFPQAQDILESPGCELDRQPLQPIQLTCSANEATYLVSALQQNSDNPRTDESGRTRDQNLHHVPPGLR
jgi:hypothetical protein